jgi:hypothetical protein
MLHIFVLLGHLLLRSLHASVGWMGTTLFALLVGLANYLARPRVESWLRREKYARPKVKERITASVLVTGITWLVLFFFGVLVTVYEDHTDLVAASGRFLQQRNAARDELRQLKQKFADDEQQIQQLKNIPPKTVYVTPHGAVTTADDAGKKQRAEIRGQLGDLMSEGRGIMGFCLHPTPSVASPEFDASCEKRATDWDERAARYLHDNLESSYLARFNTAEGLSMSWEGADQSVDRDLNYLNSRINALEQFIKELLN